MMHTLNEYLSLAVTQSELFTNPPQAAFTIVLDETEIHEAEMREAQRLASMGLPAIWGTVGIVYQDQYVSILRDAVRLLDGTLSVRTRWGGEADTPGIVVLPVHEGHVLLLRHFRHETRDWHLEIPQGFGMAGLTAEETARRELEEEIAATASRLEPLGPMHLGPDWSFGRVELFYADIASYGEFEVQEGISELLPTPIDAFERMIRNNELDNPYLLVTYTRAKLRCLL